MKIFNAKYFVVAVLVILTGVMITSCGGDKDDTDDTMASSPETALLGSWKMTWNSFNSSGEILCTNYEILTFYSDGSGFDEYEEMGYYSKDPIRYYYDSDKQILHVRNERNGYDDSYIVKSMSSTRLVLMWRDSDDAAEYEVYYKM